MPAAYAVRALVLACAVLPLGACVSGGNPSATRASELATVVSRSVACRAGAPNRDTLERFLATEKARGATPEQIAAARSTYLTVSEAESVNQSIKPTACDAQERAALREKMAAVRAGNFDTF